MFRFRLWPRLAPSRGVAAGALASLIVISWRGGVASIAPLALLAGVLVGRAVLELGALRATADRALRVTAGTECEEFAIFGDRREPESGLDGVLGDAALAVAQQTAGSAP
jgi:hypothetical protein